VVLVHPDVLAGAQPAREAVVDAAEQLLFLVRDADDRELREAVKVVDDAGDRPVVLISLNDLFHHIIGPIGSIGWSDKLVEPIGSTDSFNKLVQSSGQISRFNRTNEWMGYLN